MSVVVGTPKAEILEINDFHEIKMNPLNPFYRYQRSFFEFNTQIFTAEFYNMFSTSCWRIPSITQYLVRVNVFWVKLTYRSSSLSYKYCRNLLVNPIKYVSVYTMSIKGVLFSRKVLDAWQTLVSDRKFFP